MSVPGKHHNLLQILDALAVEECSLQEIALECILLEGVLLETGGTAGRGRGFDMALDSVYILFGLGAGLYGVLRASGDPHTAAVAALDSVGEAGAVAEAAKAFVGWACEADPERPVGGDHMEPEPVGDIRSAVAVWEAMCGAYDRVPGQPMSGRGPLVHFAKVE
jgi:hypothetical protein